MHCRGCSAIVLLIGKAIVKQLDWSSFLFCATTLTIPAVRGTNIGLIFASLSLTLTLLCSFVVVAITGVRFTRRLEERISSVYRLARSWIASSWRLAQDLIPQMDMFVLITLLVLYFLMSSDESLPASVRHLSDHCSSSESLPSGGPDPHARVDVCVAADEPLPHTVSDIAVYNAGLRGGGSVAAASGCSRRDLRGRKMVRRTAALPQIGSLLLQKCCKVRCNKQFSSQEVYDWRSKLRALTKRDQDQLLWNLISNQTGGATDPTWLFLDRTVCRKGIFMLSGASHRLKTFRTAILRGQQLPPLDLRTLSKQSVRLGPKAADVNSYLEGSVPCRGIIGLWSLFHCMPECTQFFPSWLTPLAGTSSEKQSKTQCQSVWNYIQNYLRDMCIQAYTDRVIGIERCGMYGHRFVLVSRDDDVCQRL